MFSFFRQQLFDFNQDFVIRLNTLGMPASRPAMMATDEVDTAAQPMGLPGELRQQVARNMDGLDLLNLSATCRTLRTELFPRLFVSLTLANSERSANSVALVVSKYADLIEDFTYVITYGSLDDIWCRRCSGCATVEGGIEEDCVPDDDSVSEDYWVWASSQVYQLLSSLYSNIVKLRSFRLKIVSKEKFTCVGHESSGSVNLPIQLNILILFYSDPSINTIIARSFKALQWNDDLTKLTLECPWMPFDLGNTSSGEDAMSWVLSGLKSLTVKLDLNTFLDGRECDCTVDDKQDSDSDGDNLEDIGHDVTLLLDKCCSLQDLKISANRIFLGSERTASSWSLGVGYWEPTLRHLTLSGLIIDNHLQSLIGHCVPNVQTIVFADCYASAARSSPQLSWGQFFHELTKGLGGIPISVQEFQVLNSRSEFQFDYARVVGKDYRFEIAEPQSESGVENQRTRDTEVWDRLQAMIARNIVEAQA